MENQSQNEEQPSNRELEEVTRKFVEIVGKLASDEARKARRRLFYIISAILLGILSLGLLLGFFIFN